MKVVTGLGAGETKRNDSDRVSQEKEFEKDAIIPQNFSCIVT